MKSRRNTIRNMKANTLVVLALSTSVFAITNGPVQSAIKDEAVNPFAVDQKGIGSLTKIGNYLPQFNTPVARSSILDNPVKLKIEVVPLTHSEFLPRDVSIIVSPK